MNDQRDTPKPAPEEIETSENPQKAPMEKTLPTKEFGGRSGPEPTRFGDWENNGIASDF